MPSRWFVYAVQCRDGSIYTGITTDVARRVKTHNAGKGGAYTRSRKPVRLVFREAHATRSSALKREARIKGWSRAEKTRNLLQTGSLWVCRARAVSGIVKQRGGESLGRKSRAAPDPDDR